LHVFATNRSLDHTASVRIKLADQAITALESAELLTGPDAQAANSFEQPDVIQSQPFVEVRIVSGEAALEMPPLSVMALTFQLG
jgi:alpha-L-arabinofuranosidase